MANIFIFKCNVCQHYTKIPIDPNQIKNGIHVRCATCSSPYLIKRRVDSKKVFNGAIMGGIAGAALGEVPGAIIGGIIGGILGAADSTAATNDEV